MSSKRFVDFKAVKKAVTMLQVLDHYQLTAKFKRKGDSLSGVCPIHKGGNDTEFRVSLSKNCWNCFSQCKCGGNVLDFVAKMENVSILEAALRVTDWFNIPAGTVEKEADSKQEPEEHSPAPAPKPDAAQPEKTEAKPSPQPQQVADDGKGNKPLEFTLQHLDQTHPYLAARGLTTATIGDFGLGYCKKGSMNGRVVIPIFNAEGQIVAYAGRFPGEPPEGTPKYKLPAGFRKSAELFNLDRAVKEPPDAPWVIVEGFFDCMTLWQHGVRKVVALMGSTMSTAQEALLLKHSAPSSRVIVMPDEDDSGKIGREHIVQRLAPHRFVRIAVLAEGTQPEHLTAEQLPALLV